MALRQWCTTTDLRDRIGPAVLRRMYDDDLDGVADTSPLTRLIVDATSTVAGYLRGNYDLAAVDTAVTAGTLNEVTRLTLDVAEAYFARRHPEVVLNKSWRDLLEQATNDLKALRKGDVRLDIVTTPEPAANVDGDHFVGDPDTFDETTFAPMFLEGTGDF